MRIPPGPRPSRPRVDRPAPLTKLWHYAFNSFQDFTEVLKTKVAFSALAATRSEMRF